jgi:hypothetical protein
MRPAIVSVIAVLALAGCAGSGHVTSARNSHPAAERQPTVSPPTAPGPSASPSPAGSAPTVTEGHLIADTSANRTVCRRFVKIGVSKTSANYFMARATFGAGRRTANHSSNRLINAIVNRYDDSYMSWGTPANAGTGQGTVDADCQSLGISG